MVRSPSYPPQQYVSTTIVWWLRPLLIVFGAVPLVLLGTAAFLTPNPAGLGTHQQLGLPPCSMRMLAGIRCPSCGMTTSWSRLMHGQVPGAFAANTGGVLLALASAAGGTWAVASGLRGRWIGGLPNEWIFAGVSLAIMAITLADWGVRLYMEHSR